ncbi:MAG: IS110 family transposase, partial [Mesonia sp.]
ERVIKIALANKLLKQAFSIAKNKTYYDENFNKKTCF